MLDAHRKILEVTAEIVMPRMLVKCDCFEIAEITAAVGYRLGVPAWYVVGGAAFYDHELWENDPAPVAKNDERYFDVSEHAWVAVALTQASARKTGPGVIFDAKAHAMQHEWRQKGFVEPFYFDYEPGEEARAIVRPVVAGFVVDGIAQEVVRATMPGRGRRR